MDTYYRKSEAERKQDYLALMPILTVFGGNEAEAEHARLMRIFESISRCFLKTGHRESR